MITRERAKEIAERFLLKHAWTRGGGIVTRVLSPEEVRSAAGVPEASRPDSRWRDCWLVVVDGDAGGLIYISAESGEIEFAGSLKGGK